MLEDSSPSQGLPRVSVLKLRKGRRINRENESEASEGTVRGGVGGSKERRLPKKGEGDSTQALNVLEDCEIKNKILTFPSPTTLWYYA